MRTMYFKISILLICVSLLSSYACAQDLGNINKKNIFKLNGSFNIGYWRYQANGIDNRSNPFGWYVVGSPNVYLAGINFPFTAIISDQDRSFSQPFNQVGVSPFYKWIKVHAGYRNLLFSEFTLGGATFLGGAVELTPGKLRFGSFYGRLRRRVDNDSLMPFAILPSYERWAYGGKLGYGNNSSFLDFIFLKSKDEVKYNDNETFKIKPEDNIVLGLNTELTFFKTVSLGTNLAASALTANTFLDTISLDSFSGFEQLSFINDWIVLNASTNVKFAGNSFIQIKGKKASLKFTYRYVEPGYMSHGANYIQDDLKQYLTSSSISLFKQKLILNASAGLQYNNLDNTKTTTSERTIGSINMAIIPTSRLNINLNYANFGTSTQAGTSQVNDSIYLSLINENVSAGINYSIIKTKLNHLISINTLITTTNDRNEFTRKFTQSDVKFGSINYNLGINKIQLNIGLGISQTLLNTYNTYITIPGVNTSLRKALFKKSLNLIVNYNYQKRTLNTSKDGSVSTLAADVRYNLKKRNTFTVGFTYTENSSSIKTYRTYNENRLRIQYGYTF